MRMVDRRKSIPYAHMKRQKKASRKERRGEGRWGEKQSAGVRSAAGQTSLWLARGRERFAQTSVAAPHCASQASLSPSANPCRASHVCKPLSAADPAFLPALPPKDWPPFSLSACGERRRAQNPSPGVAPATQRV